MTVFYLERVAELKKIGYVYCDRTAWWFCKSRNSAVDDRTIRLEWEISKTTELNEMPIYNYTMYSHNKINQDILDTIYRRHFPLAKFIEGT